ncbi:MAG TPA: adenylate/guanylate cyclase domain-containing protein [Chthoniobacteraceae bacterium]|jgi:adenylate cyclase
MGATLHIQPAQAEAFEVEIGNTATIGRTRENTVCLNFSPLVSRQHALIRCHNGYQFQVIDLGSRNGTFVNDQRVVMPVPLEDGSRIRIADNEITFREDAAEATEEHLEITVAGAGEDTHFAARAVSLLVCDIRGFSTMSEKTSSGQLAQVLGAWFRETGNLVAKSGGTVDKFIGDAILAYWGGDNAAADCTAALEIGMRMLQVAGERTWPNGEPFRIAVALHYGRVTCSNVGIAAERDATIIGDAVNTVFRLEAVAKELGQPLVLSGDCAEHLADREQFQDYGERALKGKSQLVRVFGVRSPDETCAGT